MDKVWQENLLCPELIGDNELCLYKNMQEFCKSIKTEFYQFRDDNEKTTIKFIVEQVFKLKNPINKRLDEH